VTRRATYSVKLRAALFLAVCAFAPYARDLSSESSGGLYVGTLHVPISWDQEYTHPWRDRLLVGLSVFASVFLLSLLFFPTASWRNRDSSRLMRSLEGSAAAIGVALLAMITVPFLYGALAYLVAGHAPDALSEMAKTTPERAKESSVLVRFIAMSLAVFVYLPFHIIFALVLVGWWVIPFAGLSGAFAHLFAGLNRLHRAAENANED